MKYILNEIKLHPLLKEEDLVKLIYQRIYGPSHILFNIENGRKYLVNELNNLPSIKYDDIEISENIIRISLHNITDINSFFDVLIETANLMNGTFKEYINEINNLVEYIKENNLTFDTDKIILLAKTNQPVHHSKEYNEAYAPHYRIVNKDLYNKLKIHNYCFK